MMLINKIKTPKFKVEGVRRYLNELEIRKILMDLSKYNKEIFINGAINTENKDIEYVKFLIGKKIKCLTSNETGYFLEGGFLSKNLKGLSISLEFTKNKLKSEIQLNNYKTLNKIYKEDE